MPGFQPSHHPDASGSLPSAGSPHRSRLAEAGLNYLAALSVLAAVWLLYTYVPHLARYFSGEARQGLTWVLLAYVVALPGYYLTLPAGHPAKCRLAWRAAAHLGRRRPNEAERVALLALAVKVYFLPLMLVWLGRHLEVVWQHGVSLWQQPATLSAAYLLLFNALLMADVVCFAVGYAIEHPRLANEIRSVDATLAGWAVTLACYPPFNAGTEALLGWYAADYPHFSAGWAQALGGAAILALMTVYAWASVALGFKASNLTHRGIVAHGPYRWVRHPAYVCKNAAWWVGGLPVLIALWQDGMTSFLYALGGLAGWTFLYYLRAITEERHLGRDPAYLAYRLAVPYRFIPGVW